MENSFANGAALLEVATTIEDLRAKEGAKLLNVTALLGFTPSLAGNAVFKVGETSYTVEGCEAGKTYYACVAPIKSASLSYTLAGKNGTKSKGDVTFEAGKIYNLGNLDYTRIDRGLSFAEKSVVAYTDGYINNNNGAPKLNGYADGVTYTSSDPSIASVNQTTGELTILETVGTTVITASAPETVDYLSGSASYILDVKQSNVNVYTKQENWDKWNDNNPRMHYWGDYNSTWPGQEMVFKEGCQYYVEFPYSKTKKIQFLVHGNEGEQTTDSEEITLNMDYYYSVWTEWKDGYVTLHKD